MDPMTIALIASAGLGLLKANEDKKAAGKRQKLEAVRERWSPWTGVHGQIVDEPSTTGTLMQALATGAMIGQGLSKSGGKNTALTGQGTTTMADDYNPYKDPHYMRTIG